MRMFEMYHERVGRGQIIPHYLEVSRRSTLLPSLAPLAEETFDTLFRQYRRISLFEFLSSLGLEVHTRSIAQALGMSDGADKIREDDFPSSSMFTALKALPQFQELYKFERTERRQAFISYLSQLTGETPPAQLVIVDVGWKGTIQDHLFAMLCRDDDTSVQAVTGFYIGLVAEGAAGPSNNKYGLLFSSVSEPSPKFHVFNENRALFEILLAADHGSIISYQRSPDGRAHAVRGDFEEHEMLETEVFPVQYQLFKHFERIVSRVPLLGSKHLLSFEEVVNAHARMVFKPSACERTWFSSVSHVENYGVFERSYFSTSEGRPSFVERLRFLIQLLQRRNLGTLGFWPWSMLYERGGALPAAIYAFIRRQQP